MFEIGFNQALHHLGYLVARNRLADDFSQCRMNALSSAYADLVPLFTVFLDAENADMADVVMTAGIHATRDVQVKLANVMQVVEVIKAVLDRLGDGNGYRVGERAEVTTWASDDVGQQADIRRCQTLLPQCNP